MRQHPSGLKSTGRYGATASGTGTDTAHKGQCVLVACYCEKYFFLMLASQGAFPIPSVEFKLIKKAWKLVNVESGVKQLTLTPSIVSIYFNINLFYYHIHSSRLKLEARSFGVRQK